MASKTLYLKTIALFSTAICLSGSACFASDSFVKIKKNQTLGGVLYSMGFRKLWGNNGFIHKVVVLNKSKLKKNGDLVFPGTKIYLPTNKTVVEKPKIKKRIIVEEIESPESADVVEVKKEDKKPKLGEFFVAPTISYFRGDYKDTFDTAQSATLLSDTNYGLNLSWRQNWDPKTKTELFFNYEKFNFQTPVTFRYGATPSGRTGFGFSYQRKVSEKISLKGSAKYGQHLFVRATNLTTLNVEAIALPSLSADLIWKALASGPFELNLCLDLSTFFGTKGSTYDVKTGFGYGAGLDLVQNINESLWLNGGILYQEKYQNTSLIRLKTTDSAFHFGLGLHF